MESPETRIIPSEDMNTVQLNISGEKFPEVILELSIIAIGLYNVLTRKEL